MRIISEEARITMNKRRNFVNYAHVTLHDGTELNLTPSDFRISGNNFTDDWNDGEAFQLGSAIGKTATILLDNTDGRVEDVYTLQASEPSNWSTNYTDYFTYFDFEYLPVTGSSAPIWEENTYYTKDTVTYLHGKFSNYDFYMSYFELKVVLPKSHHEDGRLVSTELFIGTFTVTTPASHGSTIEITGVDNMYMFDRSFNDCTLNFSGGQTLYTILRRCCTDCGVAIGFSSFLNQGIKVYKKPKDITYREVVSFIAQIAGSNAIIIPSGALKLKYYAMSPFSSILDGGRFLPWDGVDTTRDVVDGGSFNPWTEGDVIDGGSFTDIQYYHNLTATNGTTVSTDDIHFTGIMVSYEVVNNSGSSETKSVHYPDVTNWDDYAMQIAGNPFIETQAIANTVATSVWNVIAPLSFRVFSCSSIQDPTIEAGDCALVYDVKGNIYPTIITNVRFVTGGMTEVSCTAESPVKQNSRYVNPAAKAVQKAKENMDAYNTMVAHFNEIANQALGYKSTKINNVTYLYSGDTLASSANVVMISGNGIFISDNYNTPQRSWNSGVDITTATMLMNLIYVKGIQADWIEVDKLSAISANMGDVIVGGTNSGKGTLKVYKNNTITDANKVVTLDKDGINAIAGKIGGVNGWDIQTNYMRTPTNGPTTVDAITTAGTYLGSGGIMNSNGTNYIKLKSGTLTANSVDIDGGDINMKNVFHVESNGHMTCSYVTITGNNNNNDAINLGNGKFKVTNNGALTCSNVNITGANGTASSNAINLSGNFTVTNGGSLTAKSGTIAGWSLTTDNGLTWGDDAAVRRNLIACGSHGGTCIRMDGRSSGDPYGYLSVEVNTNNDWVHVGTSSIERSSSYGSDRYVKWWDGSDERIKEDIQPLSLEEARLIIENTELLTFRYKEDDKKIKHYGVTAQRMESLCEELGLENPFVKYNQMSGDLMAVDYEQFVSPIMMVVRNQQEEIDTLKQEVELLKQLVNAKQ